MDAKMKKFYIILAAALVAAACNKEISRNTSSESLNETTLSTVKVPVISGSLENTEAVRSAWEEDYDEQGNPVLHTYWQKNDQIFVTDGSNQAVYTATKITSDATSAADFTYTSGDDLGLENGLWAVYPATSMTGRSADRLTVTINDAISQDEEGKFTQWGINDLKVGYGRANDDVPSIRFKNLLATLKVNLKLAANHGIDFGENETVKSVTLIAVGNEAMAGDFSLPLVADADELTPVTPKSEIVCTTIEDVELSTDYTTSLFFQVAPGAYSSILVTINTSVRTIQRTVAINQDLERNNFYNINLTKIKNASPYIVIEDIPVPEGGWGDDRSTASKSSGAVIALWDGVYDDTQTGRYYTIQLASDSSFNNILETTNIQITYSNIYTDETHLDDGRVTFCGLSSNTRYYYRVKVMGVGDEYYSQPNTFITTARESASAMGCNYYVDFDDIKCYGTGDFMGRAVGTYPGATPLSNADEADWNDRLGFVSTSDNYSYWHGQVNPAASYKVGSSYGEMLIGSSGNPNSGIHFSSGGDINKNSVTDISKVYNRPGYIQLGTTSNAGSFKMSVGTVSLAKNKTTSATIKFKACAFNSSGNTKNATINFNLYAKSSARVSPCEISGNAAVTIPYNPSYTWQEFTVTVTTNKTTDGTDAGSWSVKYDYPRVLTVSTTNASGSYVRVFLDDIQVTM